MAADKHKPARKKPASPKKAAGKKPAPKKAPPTGGRPRGRLRRLPWRRIATGSLIALLAVVFVPPFRQAAAMVASRAILFAATPLTPVVPAFDELPETTRVLAADGTLVASLLGGESGRRAVVELEDVPLHVRQAVLAAEDAHFYDHSGIDPEAVLRALVKTALGRTQGGSTITQQLAKINYTAGERTLFRKLREVLFASAAERRYTKDELLQRYLNQVYFGDGAYGIRAAALSYFGVEPAQLTPAQGALLAGKIQAPSRLDPRKRPDVVIARRDRVLAGMVAQGWLSAAELAAAKAEPLVLAPPPPPNLSMAPHFVEYVKKEAARLEVLGDDRETRLTKLLTGGYTVETTLDVKLFRASDEAARKHLGEPGDPFAATASVEPGDGAVRSLMGGLDYAAVQFDFASQAARQPGSAFKPFVYLAALRDRIDPRTTFDGTSGRQIPCYGRPVRNYAGEDAGGHIDVDAAMAGSVNVVFVDLGCQVGVSDVIDAATDAGVPDDATEEQGAVFLGGLDKGVSPLVMASAYATFASGGVYAEPYSIVVIRDPAGKVVYDHEASPRRVFDPEQAAVLNRALTGVVDHGTGRGAGIGRPVAGKTGTTQDNVDAWFVGYVPQVATAVWVGFEPQRPMSDVHGRAVTGGSFPAMIFSDLMRAGLRGVPVQRLPVADPDVLGLRPTTTTTATTVPPPPAETSTTTTSVPAGAPAPEATTTTTTATPTTTTERPRRTTTTTRPPTTTTRPPTTTTTRKESAQAPPSTTTTTTTATTTSGSDE